MYTIDKWAVNSANKQEVNSFNGIAIADCSMSQMIPKEEKEANALLIANAPNMLQVLKILKGRFITGSEDWEMIDSTVKLAVGQHSI